jgi:hypothetical protein
VFLFVGHLLLDPASADHLSRSLVSSASRLTFFSEGPFLLSINRTLQSNYSVRQYFACVLTEFRDHQVAWQEIIPTLTSSKSQALRLDVYVWPMIVEHKLSGSKLLVRHPFMQDNKEV